MLKDSEIYIIPFEDKPVKLIFEDQLCPILFLSGIEYRCKHAKFVEGENWNFTLKCTAEKCETINIESKKKGE
jgi:hypothetical protein